MLNHLHGKSGEPHSTGSMQGWGKTYDQLVGFLSFGQERKLRQATLDLVKIQPGERILEVGCGTGTLSLAAKVSSGPQSQVSGIDIAPDMIETARRKALKAGLDVQFQVGKMEAIPFPDHQFDLVLSSLMLHHIHGDAAKQEGFKEVFRVLKPGGRLLIVDIAPPANPHIRGLASLVVGKEMLAHGVETFVPMLEQVGFVAIESGPTKSSFLGYLLGERPWVKTSIQMDKEPHL